MEDAWTTGGGDLQYSIAGLMKGAVYDIQVRAVNAIGDGPWSATTSAGTPTTPTIGAVTPGPALLTISWDRPSSDGGSVIIAYDLRHIETDADEALGSTWTVVENAWTAGGGTLRHTLAGLTGDTDYAIQVRAVNAVGGGPWSATATGTPEGASICVKGGAVAVATNEGLISDCEALLVARDTLAGTAALNWSANTPISEWDGIRRYQALDGTPLRVTGLYLDRRDLNGTIPAELGGLTEIKWLYLQSNDLTGEIPSELGNLSKLRYLLLNGNALTGRIPTPLGDLSKLEALGLSSNQLTGTIPRELGNLSELESLYLSFNQLTGEIPPALGHLSKLEYLSLYVNQLTGQIPPELGDLSKLQSLNLSFNQLTGQIPAELANLSNLESLSLRRNRLTGCIPAGLRNVPTNDLDQLRLPFCFVSAPGAPIIGAVTPGPASLSISWDRPSSDGGSVITAYDLRHVETAADEAIDSNWTLVEDVWTTGTGGPQYTLSGLIGDTGYDIQVRAVNAGGDGPWSATATGTPSTPSVCATGGAIADAANTGLASDCEALLAARDALAVSATLNWAEDTDIARWDGVRVSGTPRRVTRLSLPGKGLGGTVPAELGRLSMLSDLNLRTNGLSGPIPAELGNLTDLVRLNLHTNQLTGPVPDLSGMANLEELYLARNKLTGPIPAWLDGMTEMRELWLWGNELSGTIPDLSGMTSLEKLKLAGNNLEGGVPDASALPANLRWLILQENPLGGTIPDLSGLSSMTVLWLHTNGLAGEIPASHLPPSLTSLNLHSNQLSGVIPDLSGLDKLQWLRLQGNQLSGTIPSTLGDMASLTRLWLHENVLSGPIPAWLGGPTKLQRLWLSDNMLTGEIPEELGDLSDHSLAQWRLGGNDLTGCVPQGLADVADNDLDSLGLEVCTDS